MRIQSTELLRSSQAWDMTALPDYPSGRPELVVNRMVFPVGAKTGWHHHNVINYGIVEQGELTIVCQNGAEHTFRKGEALIEVVDTIHRGENRGNEPVILNMFYASAPGQTITVQHPEVTGITTRKVINHRQSTPCPATPSTRRSSAPASPGTSTNKRAHRVKKKTIYNATDYCLS